LWRGVSLIEPVALALKIAVAALLSFMPGQNEAS
jgi:hypothetical protein